MRCPLFRSGDDDRFGPAACARRRGAAAVGLPRKSFDGRASPIARRERLLGRGELISAVRARRAAMVLPRERGAERLDAGPAHRVALPPRGTPAAASAFGGSGRRFGGDGRPERRPDSFAVDPSTAPSSATPAGATAFAPPNLPAESPP